MGMRRIAVRRRLVWSALAIGALTLALVLHAGSQRAGAAASTCGSNNHCVVLIEVDGLEPKDVTRETTPFMWALAHPNDTGVSQIPALAGRAGWIWQAGRGVMSASTAAGTASLLTGGYPRQTGIPSDDFVRSDNSEAQLGSLEPGRAIDSEDFLADTLFDQIAEQLPNATTSAFAGDPALKPLMVGAKNPWAPVDESGTVDSSGPPTPAYCAVPQSLNTDDTQQIAPETESGCAASDIVTANKAVSGTDANPGPFVYMHLAELGRVKRLVGDVDHLKPVDVSTDVDDVLNENGNVDATAVQQQLASTDAAIAYFVNRYSAGANTGGLWKNTTVMIVGNHGYETTPQVMRVPSADIAQDPLDTLQDYVKKQDEDLKFVPQGSFGTVYYTGKSATARKNDLAALVAALGPDGPVNRDNPLCSTTGGCIQDVLYTDPADDPGSPNVRTDHSTWLLDAIDPQGKRPGVEGDLVVVMKRGWAAGRIQPFNQEPQVPGEDISNPYTASAGGPRDRAIAAIIDGPQGVVNQVSATNSDGRYPVTNGPAGDPFRAPPNPDPADTLNAVNADPSDDANTTGHELQPETVDFAPTIAALLGVGMPERQFVGRFLQEAFRDPLSFPSNGEDIGTPEPDPEPPPPPEPVVVPEPPPPPVEVLHEETPDPFPFRGLIRNVSAQVVDADGKTLAKARKGALMSSLEIQADFGKPKEAVTLTFYRRAAGAAAAKRGKKRRLKAMVHFKPFAVTRGPKVKLRLKVPPQYHPTHVGIVVQEVPSDKKADKKSGTLEGDGPKDGSIVEIKDYQSLHKHKPAGRRATRKR
jgi:hypothetical protein